MGTTSMRYQAEYHPEPNLCVWNDINTNLLNTLYGFTDPSHFMNQKFLLGDVRPGLDEYYSIIGRYFNI